MECRLAGLLFTSKFDSGNLARVERVGPDDDDEDGTGHRVGDANAAPDYEFNLWTNPDCGGTEFENGNRTWFHFAVKGCPMNKLIRFNIMNMNKQGKLYNQGLAPVVKVLPQKPRWERIRDRPSHETVDGQFILSFTYRFEYRFSTVYFAFCYPYSYTEYQDKLTELDNKFSSRNYDSGCPNSAIYYHRELLCHSLDKLRVDLITISSCHGLTTEREPRLHRLFPDTSTERARKFKGKRVYFLSSRVHPGETPASFVFNGFFDFILRSKDERAIQLRKQYVFKLVPLLNPDGVQRGYYRTDQRGVNLNRVYLNPDPDLHPSIFAAKSVVLHHHVNSRVVRSSGDSGQGRGIPQESGETPVSHDGLSLNKRTAGKDNVDGTEVRAELGKDKFVIEKKGIGANAVLVVHRSGKNGSSAPLSNNEQKRHSPIEEGRNSCGDRLSPTNDLTFLPDSTSRNGKEISRDDMSVDDSDVESDIGIKTQTALSCNMSNNNAQMVLPVNCGDTDPTSIPSEESGIAFYVDLHGHASKRGCFIYGNFHEDEERQTENLLFPKLIAMNSAHFDFDGCNFTEKNMYTKDRRDGMSKEGSGRVGIYKATGIIHSYTLECNYNSGRFVNSLAPASNDDGRATPPPLAGYPPKYGPQHYEEVGRATAIAALDITDTNPWSRLAGTENGTVHGVRAWVQRYLRSMRGAPSLPKKMSRVASKTSSLVATVMTPPKPNRTNMFQSGNSGNNAGNSNTTSHSNPQQNASNSPKRNMHSKPLGPVRETRASMERRKHLATLQGTGISTSTASSATSTSTTTTVGVASTLSSGGKNFTIPLPLTHHKQSPPSTTRSLKAGPMWAHKKNKSDSVLGKNASESVGQKDSSSPLSPRTLLSKSTNNLGAFTHHGGPLASSTLPSVVTELLNSVMINAMEGSKDLNKEESQTFSSASVAQQRTAMYVKNHGAPSALSPKGHQPMFSRHRMTIDLGASSSSQPVQHHGNIHVEGDKSDLKALGSLCLHEDSRQDSADKTKKRRKKVNGPKRRSISHSPSRKSQKNSHRTLAKGGKHSETDSEPERSVNRRMERTRQRSLTSSLSDPTPNDLHPMSEHTAAFTSNLDHQRGMTPKRSRSISSIQEPSYLKAKVGNPVKKSNSFTGSRRDSSVSYQVVELNDLQHRRPSQKTPIPVKKIGFWVDF